MSIYKQKITKDNVSKETLARVSYIYGILQADNLINDDGLDLDGIINICTDVAVDWANMVNINNYEEEGYVTAYAQRVLVEKLGNKPV